MTVTAALILLTAQVVLPEPNRDEPLAGKVSLTLTSAQTTYYVGETVRLQLEIHNFSDGPVIGWFNVDPAGGKATVYFRRGTTQLKPLAHLDAGRYGAQPGTHLDPDAKLTHRFVAAFDPETRLPLVNEPGEYDFQVEYKDFDSPNGVLLSNILPISVLDVSADQREALAAYRQGLAFFAEFRPTMHNATPTQIQAAADFLERFRGSLYWRDVLNGLWAAVGERVQAKVASDFEKALLQKIREEWADSTPPALNLSPDPSTLWPPNQKLVPVTISVTVTDDQDPSAEVRLLSITCDDGCDTAQDVAGATLHADDRDFELRAERLGTGSGRTYTITYSATDVAGNIGTATTTVVVPHDQGEKK
jgi:hypothetical protein